MGVIVLIDNSMKQKVKMFLPKLIGYLDKKVESGELKYVVVKGDADGLKNLKKIQLKTKIDGVIMSGSPLMPTEETKIEDYVCNLYCLKHMTRTPILGICFGCQLITLFFSGRLVDLGHVTCKRMKVETHIEAFKGIKQGKFCARFLPVETPTSSTLLDVLITVNNEEVGAVFPCMIRHRTRDVIGVMFHPEALKSTHIILDSFINRCVV